MLGAIKECSGAISKMASEGHEVMDEVEELKPTAAATTGIDKSPLWRTDQRHQYRLHLALALKVRLPLVEPRPK